MAPMYVGPRPWVIWVAALAGALAGGFAATFAGSRDAGAPQDAASVEAITAAVRQAVNADTKAIVDAASTDIVDRTANEVVQRLRPPPNPDWNALRDVLKDELRKALEAANPGQPVSPAAVDQAADTFIVQLQDPSSRLFQWLGATADVLSLLQAAASAISSISSFFGGEEGAPPGGTVINQELFLTAIRIEIYNQIQNALGPARDDFVLFDTNSHELPPSAAATLDAVLTRLAASPGAGLRIVGHTDRVGEEAANRKLADDRAQAVSQYLTARVPDARLVTVESRGETAPPVPTYDGAPEPRNRIVTIEIVPGP